MMLVYTDGENQVCNRQTMIKTQPSQNYFEHSKINTEWKNLDELKTTLTNRNEAFTQIPKQVNMQVSVQKFRASAGNCSVFSNSEEMWLFLNIKLQYTLIFNNSLVICPLSLKVDI